MIIDPTRSAQGTTPLVSVIVVSPFKGYPWLDRVLEYLLDDSLRTEDTECIVYGAQDIDFAKRARPLATQAARAYSYMPGVPERWKRVRFVTDYFPGSFNVTRSHNRALRHARGLVVVYRDADVRLVQRSGFLAFALKELMRSRFGLLCFPSINNGGPGIFKPEPEIMTRPGVLVREDDRYPGFLLLGCATGMATAGLRSIAMRVPQNQAASLWGTYTNLCALITAAGYPVGTTWPQIWLSAGDTEASISLTRSHISGDTPQTQRAIGVGLINRFYNIRPGHPFWEIQTERYRVDADHPTPEVAAEINRRWKTYVKWQTLPINLNKFPRFGPWDWLTHGAYTEEFLDGAQERAAAHFSPVEIEMRKRGLDHLLTA